MTDVPYIISDEALADLTDIVIWYEKQSFLLGDRFLSEFYNVSLEKIRTNSKAFTIYVAGRSIRGYKMRRFPYKIFYDDSAIPIKIIAIIHTSRSLNYIQRRLK